MKRLFFSLITCLLTATGVSALTPQQAYREICDIPTVQQSMPAAQFNIGSKISLIGAQTAQSVATKQSQVDAIASEVQNIITQIEPSYFIVSATSDGVTTIYYAQEKKNGLFDLLRIDYLDSQNLWSATFAETSPSTINYLKGLQEQAENAVMEMENASYANEGTTTFEETSKDNEAGTPATYETSSTTCAPAIIQK